MASLSAMILAGGHSRRMKTDKALLCLPNGQRLIEKTAQIAQALTSDVIVVTPWPERYAAVLPPTVRRVAEKAHQNGPLGGFEQGWAALQSDWCLVLACDLPRLEHEPLCAWWRWLQQQEAEDTLGEPDQRAIASLTRRKQTFPKQASDAEKRWEPLCGFYHRDCLESLRDRLHTTRKEAPDTENLSAKQPHHLSFQAWLQPLPVREYNKLPESALFNCNTTEDWAQITSADCTASK